MAQIDLAHSRDSRAIPASFLFWLPFSHRNLACTSCETDPAENPTLAISPAAKIAFHGRDETAWALTNLRNFSSNGWNNGRERAIRARRFRSERERCGFCLGCSTGRQDSYRRRFYGFPTTSSQPHRQIEPGWHIRHRFQPKHRGQCGPFNRSTAGRQDLGGRLFYDSQWSDAQPDRPARCHDWPG